MSESAARSVEGLEHYLPNAKPTWHQLSRRNALMKQIGHRQGQRILDYGCGYGDLTALLNQTNTAIGVDVGEQNIRFAQQYHAGTEFHLCRLDGVDFESQSFDMVLSSVVIHFVPNADAYLAEIHRVLKPGGELILAVRNVNLVGNAIRRLVGKPKEINRLWVVEQAQMRQHIQQAGFRIEGRGYFHDSPMEEYRVNHRLTDFALCLLRWGLFGIGVKSVAPYVVYRLRKA